MSWFTVGEIAVWLTIAAVLGVALGWLLHEIWDRRRAAGPSVEPSVEPVIASPADPTIAPPAEPPAEPEPAVEPTIKGNSKSMIYHVPGSPLYERTRADEWFVTEDEATRAGYRKPKNQ